MFEIVDIEQDMSGKFRVRIRYEDNIMCFKFKNEPTNEQINSVVENYIQKLNNVEII